MKTDRGEIVADEDGYHVRVLSEEAKFVSSASDPSKSELRGTPFLHASLKPLDEVDLDSGQNQINMFGNDCTGHCNT